MATISLIIILISVIIFYVANLVMSKFINNKTLANSLILAYLIQIFGLGLLIYSQVEFSNLLQSSELKVSLANNLPDLIRAFSEILWPLGALILLFWFMPEVLDLIRDPRKSQHILEAWRKNDSDGQQSKSYNTDISSLPEFENFNSTQKQNIKEIDIYLNRFSASEENAKLKIVAANFMMEAHFEMIYNLIFGTQIEALKNLLVNQNIDLTPFFELHRNKMAPQKTTFKKWSIFLLDFKLIQNSDKKNFKITEKGVDLIKYLQLRNYNLLKGL